MTLTTWLTFTLASWAISFSPGAGAICAMSSGLRYGAAHGYWTTVGLVMGIAFQVTVVGLGVGALLAASETGFLVVKWIGALYLIWLGIKQWRAEASPVQVSAEGAANETRWQLIAKGCLVNASNPKGTVFLLAVVPQFLNPAAPLAPQYLIIGATLAFTDAVVMGFYTILAARVLRLLRTPRQIRGINRTFGGLFMAAGAWLATFTRSVA